MESFWQSYKSGIWVTPFLYWSIVLFVTTALLLFMLIMIIRSEKIERRKRYGRYDPVIDKLFMLVVFGERSYDSIKADPEYSGFINLKNFRKQMMKSIINLHQNYDGQPARTLEHFYFESGLIRTSFGKLKSRKLQEVCSGIQELAEMNITKAFPMLVKLSRSDNKVIKITAIKACAKLNGNKGIVHLTYHKDPIDMWEQINIIGSFKRNYAEENEEVEILLTSGNSTVISLGLKIIHTLELARKVPYVADLIENAPNEQIRLEAQELMHFLTTKIKKGDDWL
jgi:hypothetical protein